MAPETGIRIFGLLSLNFLLIKAFNLDTSVPIVKEGPNPNAYFGYSVAQHQIMDDKSAEPVHTILVGSPLDNMTDPSANVALKSLTRPGVVYRCPVTSNFQDCTSLKLVGSNDPKVLKDNAWFGVSVVSQGTLNGQAVVCSHRTVKTDNFTNYAWGNGGCIGLNNDLDEIMLFLPCDGRRPGHNNYGFCQAGTSVAVSTEDDDVLIGTPGAVNWRGAVFKNINPSNFVSMRWYNSPVEDLLQTEDGPEPVNPYYSYLGMSTSIGRVLGKNLYIGGAPRAGDSGQVLLFTQGKEALNFEETHRLLGEQFGSGFGSSVITIDLDSDLIEDLVVGAPFYHGNGIGGMVYVYMNLQGITTDTKPIKIPSREMTPAECRQLNCNNARFGSALANVGDLDRDGYPDLAVGAPFEGKGVIYIFRGSVSGVIEKYSQRIAASDLLTAGMLSSFGHQIVGGNDLDENGYPDITVSAYESNKIVILRTRPVVKINTLMVSDPTKIDPALKFCKKNNMPNNCFRLRVCFKFTAEPKDKFTGQVPVDYKIEAEKFAGKKTSRVFFRGSGGIKDQHIVEGSISMKAQDSGEYQCHEHDVYISSKNKDFLRPIMFRLTYKLQDQPTPSMVEGLPLPDINNYPVINEADAVRDLPVHFMMDCGSNKKCESDLEVAAKYEGLIHDPDKNSDIFKVGVLSKLRLNILVTNKGEDAHEATLYVHLPESIKYTNVEPADGPFSCSPNITVITCSIGNPLKKDATVYFTMRLDASDIALGDLTTNVTANTTSTDENDDNNVKSLKMKVIVESDMLVRTQKGDEVFYGGEVRGESAMKKETEVGPLVIHRYEVKNNGRGKVANSTVFISWPYEVASGLKNGKHLLYLLEEPKIDKPGKCEINKLRVNPLGLELSDEHSLSKIVKTGASSDKSREKRSYEHQASRSKRSVIPYRKIKVDGNWKRVVVLECDETNGKTANCFSFHCVIGELLPSQSVAISIRARLWNSTFVEDYRDIDQMHIYSMAKISIDPALSIVETNTYNDIAKALTIAKPDIEIKESPGIPLWVIILSACCGIILLIIIILALWACGFFKRNKHEEEMRQYKGKLYKKTMDDDFDAYN